MSSITIPPAITQASGYDQNEYESLLRQATARNVDAARVNDLLCSAIEGGKSFSQALALVGLELPALAPPASADMTRLKDWVGLPSPGALIMSATTEFAAEQRRQNQELMWQETEALTESMKDQAQKMRDAAVTQLAMGIASGALQIGMGVAQVGMGAAATKAATSAADAAKTKFVNDAGAKASTKAINQGKTPSEAMTASQKAMNKASPGAEKIASETFSSRMMSVNININAVGQIGGGVVKGIDSGAQYVSAQMQAKAKEMEADQEAIRAVRESIRNLDESLHALIQKSLAAQNDIQASTNQARTRILA